ncbi:MAG: MATE family efflux transporter [Microbacterium sp.]|uniref:MATE family efflux transporter n=1 Tax=Microbacterium sp. TaxID=51671 RepID=UPI001AD45675|nr:MATE family efflux transporter [Microbacterium sp.]MBN9153635.1 MATE family efflux transporter [Microbacterium sp.]MBN9173491.1 MATE family efflux transporter [Microbacterium sp.]
MSSNNRFYLASAPIWRALIHLCIPMIAGMSVGAVYNVINGGFIGSLHSTPLLAALTFSLPVFALIMAIGGMFGVGGGTYISRLLGAQEQGGADAAAAAVRVKQVSSFTMWASLAAGAVIGALGVVFATPIATAVGATGASLAPTALYIGAMFAFAPILVACFSLEQIVRAEGAAVASMTGLIASTIANLIFDVLFIIILGWGVLGAGIALGLSNVVMVGYYIWWLTRKSEVVSLAPRWFRADRAMLTTVFGVGVSELLQSSFLIVTTLVMNWIAIGYGDALLASMGVALRISQLPEMMCMGVFVGVIPLLAYAFGARNAARLRQGIAGAAISIVGITVVFSTIVFLFREQVIGLFSVDPKVLTDGTLILTAMLVSTIFNGITGLVIAVFQATEQMRNATIMSIAQGVLFIPVVLVGNAVFGITGVIWAMTVTELLTFALGMALFAASRRALAAEPSPEAVQAAAEAVAADTAAESTVVA